MLGTQNLGLFLLSSILLNLTPGQDTLYILGRTLAQGRRAGFLSVAGIMTGCLVHTITAALGISAILATSASAFVAVKTLGAAYLVVLGAQLLLARPDAGAAKPSPKQTAAWATFRDGLLTNVLNPKVALFFLAFLPQFVGPDCEAKAIALFFLGSLFFLTGSTWSVILVLAADFVRQRLDQSQGQSRRLQQATGLVFIGLGVKLAATNARGMGF